MKYKKLKKLMYSLEGILNCTISTMTNSIQSKDEIIYGYWNREKREILISMSSKKNSLLYSLIHEVSHVIIDSNERLSNICSKDLEIEEVFADVIAMKLLSGDISHGKEIYLTRMSLPDNYLDIKTGVMERFLKNNLSKDKLFKQVRQLVKKFDLPEASSIHQKILEEIIN